MNAVPQTRRWEPVAPPPEPSNPGDGDGEVVLQDPARVLPPPPPCHGGMPVFSVLTTLFEALANERKQDRRRGMLERWFSNWRANVGNDFYPILRLLLPQKDRERSVYFLKEATIAKAFIAVLGIDKTPDAIALLHWKKPMPGQRGTVGDFPTTLWEVVSKRSTVMEGTLRIDQLNELLDELSKSGSKLDNSKRIFAQLFLRATPSEIRWIARIILKDLIISVKETTILSVFHPDALAVFNSCSDLKRVAYELWDPTHRLEESEKTIHLFRSFAPMLSKRPLKTLAEAVRKVGERDFIIEEKLDGERIQLHKRGAEYFYCSRKGKDYTYLYGRHVGEGSLTPFIDGAFDPRVHDCILDGEMLVWDPVSETYLPFGHLKTHASDKAPKKRLNPRPCFMVFDLLYLNGKSLIDRSLIERKKNLRSIFKHVPGRLENVNEFPGNSVKDVQDRLRQVVEARGEGLIVKHPRSPYILNGRVDHWIKIKPEYMDGMTETVDLLVVAGNYGTGRRAGGVSTLICALLDEGVSKDGEITKYSTFCRIGTGLSYADFVGIRERKWVEWEKGEPLDFLQAATRSQDDKGDVYIRPEDSFVITVKAADFIISDQYYMPLTLRFPRAVRIRDELTAEDSATVNDIWKMHTTRKKRKAEEEQAMVHTKKRKTAKRKVEVAGSHQVAKVDDVTVTTNILKDDVFVIIKSIQPVVKYDVAELQRIIVKHGGDFRTVSRGGDNEIIIFGGKNKPPNIKNYIAQNRKIVYPQWILDSDRAGTRLPLRKRYFFHKPTEGSDTEEESADEGNGSEHVKEEPVDDEVPLFIPPESPRPHVDHVEHIDLDALPHSDWIKLEPTEASLPPEPSDNAALLAEDDYETDKDDPVGEDGGWVDLFEAQIKSGSSQSTLKSEEQPGWMGEDDKAQNYDENVIFKHLVFYLDSPDNARVNNMKVWTGHEKAIAISFDETREKIIANGGRVTSELNDPKLTHVVLDDRDRSRRVPLMRATELPKRKRLVLREFIDICIEDGTLRAEEDWEP